MPSYLYITLAVLSLIWGGSFFFVKILIESFDPWTTAFFRCLFGVITLLPFVYFKRREFILQGAPWVPLLLVGLFNSAIPWVLIAYSETKITSGLASVLNATTPIWTMLLGILLFRLSSTIYQVIGMMLGFIGILIIADINWVNLYVHDSLAIAAMLLVTLCYGFATQVSKKYLQAISVYQIAFATLFVGSIVSGVMAISIETIEWTLLLQPSNFWSLIGLGSLGSGIAYILFFLLIQKGSPQFATLVTYLAPPFAIMWGALFLQEKVTFSLILGLIMILAGVYVSGKRKKEPIPITEEKIVTANAK